MGAVVSFFERLFGTEKKKEEERFLRANDRAFNLSFKYADNSIKTSKYNILTFLPLNLFEQLQRLANVYFCFLFILQLIPQVSSLSWFTTAVPLTLVLGMTAVKDAADDINRHKNDNQVNNREVDVLLDGDLKKEKWKNVKVGDIIRLENNEFVTADLLLLSSSEPLNLVYVETAELDGETNLKVRQALTVTGELGDNFEALTAFNGEVRCEPPNNRLDKFKGTLTFSGQSYALDNDKVLLRGCTLRNTEWCYGLVIFGGADTKLMQNSGKSIFKRTSIDHLMNVLVLCIFGFLASMCTVLAIGNAIWESKEGTNFLAFLPYEEGATAQLSSFLSFWSYVIVLNTVVPISLYVSVEIIRLGNSFFIDWDRKMYYPKSDTPAQARTTTLNEELGQIKYIFSDKTGTLTQNIMTFNKCSINGRNYGELFDFSGQRVEITDKTERVDFSWNKLADPKFMFHDHSLVETVKEGSPEAQGFFRLLAVCHTVMPEEKNPGELYYQAQSPDEGALVTAARNFGFVFLSRTPESITVVEMGQHITYELIAVLDFNNIRKRMSVVVRNPEGKTTLYCKGADTIIYERLHPSCKKLMEVTTQHLNEYAGDGLRTLVLAYKDLDEEYMEDWRRRHHEASIAMEGREEMLDQLYEEIEKDLMLLGASAVEDKLQDGVPQTIEQLAKADIKIWVLTGDKQAAHIGVGISGQEGMQAVLSSDFSFAQFRYLQRLLLVHGRWSYLRMCKFLQYFFYKNFTFTFVHFWYAFFCGFSAQTVYDEWFITFYNLVYTALPVLGMSLFDQDVNDRWSFQYPQLYVPGQLNFYFSKKIFVRCMLHSCYSSLVLFFVPWAAMVDTVRDDGKDIADYQSFALLAQTCLLVVVNFQLCLDTHYWTAVNQFFVWGSLSAYFAISFTMYSNGMFLIFTSAFPFIGTARNSLNQPSVWLTILLTTLLCILPVVAVRFIFYQLRPTINDKVRYKVRKEALPAPAPRRPPPRRISTRRSGYAFSHSQGYGDLVTSKWVLLKRKSRPPLFTKTSDSPLAQNQPQLYRTITEENEEAQTL
ncbi:phospholipid-transporting ATPase ID-like [Boleophthalmus pectinirostris]|uniref:phospholipid-transporting ATPase ID-like n=1 Tax=Boleophthalmus pectinirostris TaxID=150288 RepID=UPI00242CF836|nr:phospholipid-transporting ATPase ID-like [Boleophthalmus pectinirostris]